MNNELPHNVEAEASVIGACLLDASAYEKIALDETDFFRADHRAIWRAIATQAKAGNAYDVVTLGDWLLVNGLENETGGMAKLISIANATPGASAVKEYAAIVLEYSNKRRLIAAGYELVSACFKEGNASDIYMQGVRAMSQISDRIESAYVDPIDLLETPAGPAFKHEMLPPMISDYCFAMSEVTGIEPDMYAHAALVACAGCIDDAFQLQPLNNEPDWRESARLWGLVCALSGAGKTTVEKKIFAPVKEINKNLMLASKMELAEYQTNLDIAKVMRKKTVKEVAEAEASGMGLAEPPPEIPQKPREARLLMNDFTVEKVSEIASENPRGLIIAADELKGWFKSMDAYRNSGGKDRPLWLQYYNGGSMIFDRIGRGTTYVENWGGCIWGGCQPDVLIDFAKTDGDDGMLQRFIPLFSTTKPKLGEDIAPARMPALAYTEIINRLFNTSAAGEGGLLRFSPEAYDMHRDISQWSLDRASAGSLPPMMASWLMKWRGLFPRICVTMHCIESAVHQVHPTRYSISGKTASRVMKMMFDWMYGHGEAFYNFLSQNQSDGIMRGMRDVAVYILSTGSRELVSRELRESCRSWRDGTDASRMATVRGLIEAGWLLHDGSRMWSPPARIAVNPRVHTKFSGGKITAQELKLKLAKLQARLKAGGE